MTLSTYLYRRPRLVLVLLLLPPALWLGVIYLGSLGALLVQSLFHIDDFSGQLVTRPGIETLARLFSPTAREVISRTALAATIVTVLCALLGFPLAYYMARYAGHRMKAVCYIAVMLPLWSNYLVRVTAWRLILAKEGVASWFAAKTGLSGMLEFFLGLPGIGGPSLSSSALGTVITFVYIWLPYMILPIQAALERVPRSLVDASSDLGARPTATFWRVILPLAIPGIAAGSIFTFSLTLGDYIIPNLIGTSRPFIGQIVYQAQGTAGDIPFAAAFALVPIAIMAIYLMLVKRLGAFDAL
ncbi:MAG TPA: ABC transporter permease [Dongiaceae bacterium]|jgi:putative spermidine/putrescine transport system permease protein|nr:ABC transporter permease [Dongiaceae bacterium]